MKLIKSYSYNIIPSITNLCNKYTILGYYYNIFHIKIPLRLKSTETLNNTLINTNHNKSVIDLNLTNTIFNDENTTINMDALVNDKDIILDTNNTIKKTLDIQSFKKTFNFESY